MTASTLQNPSPIPAVPRRTLRSVGAVLGGLVATFIVTTAVDVALHSAFGPLWYSLANIAVAFPCAWFGGRLALPRVVRARS